MDSLIETWRAHSAIGLYLLSNLPEGGLDAAPISNGMRVSSSPTSTICACAGWITPRQILPQNSPGLGANQISSSTARCCAKRSNAQPVQLRS